MENVYPTFAGILRGFETATVEPQGRRVAANRINHKDTEFDADYATVCGNDARNYQIGSFIEVNRIARVERDIAPDLEEKYAHEAWMAHA